MTDAGLKSKAGMRPMAANIDAETAQLILAAVSSLRYGAVEVTVHDGRVVQLDKRERIRITS